MRALAELVRRRSPTAVASFKRAALAGRGESEGRRLELESDAYLRTVEVGDAAVGRANFAAILAGETPPWAPRRS